MAVMVMAMARSKVPRQLSATTGSRGSPHPTWFLPLTAALPAFFVCPVWAAKWDIVPTFTAQESYTDNVSLTADGSARGEFVTQLRPAVSVQGSGPRLRVNASYSADLLLRSERETREFRNQFLGDAQAELLQQLLFVDARGSVSQQNISLLGPQSDSNINTSGNRANVKSFLVSPYLRHAFGADAQGEARFTYSTVRTDSPQSLSNSDSTSVNVRLSSGPSFKVYSWGIAYSRESIDYAATQQRQVQQDVTTQTITATGRRLITPQFALTSSLGYEKSDYLTLGAPPQGAFWNTGFEWTPTDRTRLAASIGRRYFGDNNSFEFSHRTRLTVWSAGYSESITNTRSQFLLPSTVGTATYLDSLFLSQFPDPVARQQAVQNFILLNGLPQNLTVPLNFFANQTFLEKRWHASVAWQGVRNTLLGNVFKSTRTAQEVSTGVPGAGDFGSTNNVVQTGAGVNWNWRISPYTASNFGVGYTRSEFTDAARDDSRKYLNLTVTHQFSPKVSGALSYRRLENESNQSTSEYAENVVSASVNMRF